MGERIAFLDSAGEASRLGLDASRYKFFCSTMTARDSLADEGLDARCWDDYLAPDRGARAQELISDVLKSWYMHCGKDVTRFRGASLGELSGVFPVYFLVPAYRWAIALTEIIGKSGAGSALTFFPEDDFRLKVFAAVCGSLGVRHENKTVTTPGLMIFRPEYRFQKRYPGRVTSALNVVERSGAWRFFSSASIAPRTLYVLDVGVNRFLWDHWLESDLLKSSVRLGFVKQFPPGRNAMSVLRRGGDMIDGFGVRLSPDERGTLRLIADSFEKAAATVEWREKFRLDGIDLGAVFFERFSNLVRNEFPTIASILLSHRASLKGRSNTGVLVFNDVLPHSLTLLTAAEENGLPTFFYEHGLVPTYSGRQNLMKATNRAKYILVWGREQKNALERLDPELNGRVAQVAPPPEKVPAPVASSQGEFALLMSFSRALSNVNIRPTDEERFALGALKILKKLGERRVVVKLHPSASKPELYLSLAKRLPGGMEVTVDDSPNPIPLIRRSRMVVGPISTTVLAACSLGRPYYCAHPDAYPTEAPFDGSYGPVAKTLDELEANILNSRPLEAERILDDFASPGDGNPAEMVFRSVLERML